MTSSGVLRAPQAGHITCRSQCTSAAWRGGTSMRKEQAANSSGSIRSCGEVVRCLSAASARCGLCRDDRGCCRAQRPQRCAASAGGIDIGSSSRRDSTASSLASHRLASRLAAPSAVQHSTDVRSASAATQPADTAVANEGDLHGSNGAGYSKEAAAERPTTSQPCSRENGQRPLDQHDQPPESGILTHAQFGQVLSDPQSRCTSRGIPTDAALSSEQSGHTKAKALFLPDEKSQIKDSWRKIMRWSKVFNRNDVSILEATQKVVIFGGGSFGTAVGAALARQKADLDVTMLLRDPYVCQDINTLHRNRRYLDEFTLPSNLKATTSVAEALADAQFAVHAVPVQHSRRFLSSIKGVLPPDLPLISVSKGLEVSTGQMMSEIIPSALQRKQPAVFLSGPSFAREVMELCPTVVVVASKDGKLAQQVQQLLAGPYMRVNTSTDVTGVEICGALKNVLAIAAGIVQGLELGNNAMAALLCQGCAEIRWLADKMGAKPETVSGLSGLGDIMLTCYGALSRNRAVGMRLGQGEALDDILASSSQVAEGVSTAAAVVGLGRKYRVALPVLTAVAQVLDGNLSPKEVVYEIMNLPQIHEK